MHIIACFLFPQFQPPASILQTFPHLPPFVAILQPATTPYRTEECLKHHIGQITRANPCANLWQNGMNPHSSNPARRKSRIRLWIIVSVIVVLLELQFLREPTWLRSFDSRSVAFSTLVERGSSRSFPATAVNKKQPKICPPQRRFCPSPGDYARSCSNSDKNLKSSQRPSSSSLETSRDDALLDHLLHAFQNQRVTLVGDSLMRQWYETLTCRLGLQPQWFPTVTKRFVAETPLRRLQVAHNEFNLSFPDLHRSPSGMKKVAGYSIATTAEYPSKVTTQTLVRAAGKPSLGTSRTKACTASGIPFQSTLEYFHLEELSRLEKIPGNATFSVAQRMMEFFFQKSTVVIFNLGIHYRVQPTIDISLSLSHDIGDLFQACSQLQSTNSSRHCLFRETFPQHWVPQSSRRKFPQNWAFNLTQIDRTICGPFDVNIHSGIFGGVAQDRLENIFQDYSSSVGVVRVQELWKEAWQWHPPGDCTHFCRDAKLWDLIHGQLLKALSVGRGLRGTRTIL
jgi:hypothetical protein